VFPTDPVTLADDGAVTAFQEKSNIERFGRTRFEDNPDRESVSRYQEPHTKVSGSHMTHQERFGSKKFN
jgi:hypothetical protein